GIVPEAIVGDAFLPENLRSLRSLRLKTNDERLVRDIYLLRALIESRRGQGRVDLLVPKTNADGDPRRPSRLLFRCAEGELPARVMHLFQDAEAKGNQTSWAPGFALVPGIPRDGAEDRPITKIAVTAFATYLNSPFHFWAQRLMRLDEIDPDKAEMDALDFGNFCHSVLERYGRDEAARTWTDAEKIDAYFQRAADEIALVQYGRRPGLAVRIQIDSAKRRLSAAAEVEAAQRQEGWVIVGFEAQLAKEFPLSLGGIDVAGEIDRLERNGDVIRILDFKTSDRRNAPKKDHFVENRLGDSPEWPPDYAFFDHADFTSRSSGSPPAIKSYRFKNLQLPLYALAVSQVHPEAELHCGYFHLTKAASDVGPDTWAIDDALLDAARTCAEGVIEDVKAGRFGRIIPRSQDDAWEAWHLGVPERTLDLTHVGGGDERPQSS
ncbi:MAG: PD-(D/E)XK nuclease family protein, partial [Verrucomicrobiae bacterium]|nr:PD-(D/E)XK nuclease family protein [Verrucomicrobiae bacterium]